MTLHVAHARRSADMVRTSTPPSPLLGAGGEAFQCRSAARVQTQWSRSGSGGTMGETRRSCHQAKAANRRELAVERAAKKEAVEALNGLFKTTSVAVVAHYSGLTVAQMQKLRMQ